MGIIKARQLVHEYIRRDEEGNVESISTALDHVDLDVEAGDFIAILGHNGSGKSTLAKHINALLLPSEGSLWVDGRDVTKEENTFAVRQTAGMVFQNPDNQIIGNNPSFITKNIEKRTASRTYPVYPFFKIRRSFIKR